MENDLNLVKVGDTLGVRAHRREQRLYRLVTVERVTKTMIIADQRKFYREQGLSVDGLGWVVTLTPKQIADWNAAKEKQIADWNAAKAKWEEEVKNRRVDDHDDT